MKRLLKIFIVVLSLFVFSSCSNKNGFYFDEGVYEAYENGKLSLYYVFYGDIEGGSIYFLDGNGVPFRYELKDRNKTTSRLVFHIGDEFDNTNVKAVRQNRNKVTIEVENSGTYELKRVDKKADNIDKVLNNIDKVLKKNKKKS